MFRTWSNEHHLRGKQRGLVRVGSSDVVALTPLAHSGKHSGVLGNILWLLLQSQTNCTQRSAPKETGGKGTRQLDVLPMEGRAIHISDNLFPFLTHAGFSKYHHLTQLLSTSTAYPIRGAQRMPQHYLLWLLWSLAIKTTSESPRNNEEHPISFTMFEPMNRFIPLLSIPS